jgi:hypothetical protein
MVLITAFLVAGVLTDAPADSPLQAGSPIAERGEVKSGPPLSHTFTLTNRGPGRLAITAVETGCGCIRSGATRTELRPSESTDVTVEINTLTQPEGLNAWKVTVRYQADPPPAPPQAGTLPRPGVVVSYTLELRVAAKLVREVSVTPPAVAISTDAAATQTLTVADRRDRPLTITRAVSTSAHVQVTVRPADVRDGRRVQFVDLKVPAETPAGHHDVILTLYTDDPAYPELGVPVRVSKRTPAAMAVSPEAVTLRFATGQVEASAVAVVRAQNGAAVRISKVECDDPAVRLKWSREAGAVATVRVTLSLGAAGRAEVRVLLAEPAGHMVALPVSWGKE